MVVGFEMKKILFLTTFAIGSLLSTLVWAGAGVADIQGKNEDGPVTIFYPTDAPASTLQLGPFQLQVTRNATPKQGNQRLIVISHGSGGNPWVHSDLALRLVKEGFVVAIPEHKGDNYKNPSSPGPESWKQRPLEVSRAIDTLLQDARFSLLLQADKVGMYGMSAGGHTALTLAGGKWSGANLRKHCETYIAEDFQTCVGLSAELTGGVLDGFKKSLSLAIIRSKLSDEKNYGHTDPRIKAIVAGVPFAADFDMNTLQTPAIPLALVTAAKDKWLTPRFHSDVVLASCKSCIRLGHFSTGGHGALLSPLPPNLTGLLADLIYDPVGFDRQQLVPAMDSTITEFFQKQLLN
jgi:predicted dienelactone hydrolase